MSTETTHDFKNGKGPVPAHRHRNPNGTEGGWVAATAMVEDGAYVDYNAKVFENARVLGQATIADCAMVYGSAVVADNASVKDTARVFGSAHLREDAEVSGEAWVHANAQVYGAARVEVRAIVYGNAQVYDNAVVTASAHVYGHAHVYETATIAGRVKVGGDAKVASGQFTGTMVVTDPPVETSPPPDYYLFQIPGQGTAQVMDVIDGFSLNFNRGCVVKYTLRAGRKSAATELEDLKKARNCLNREIERLEEQEKK